MTEYHKLSDEDLLTRVSDSPPDTPDWTRSNAELQRRVASRREDKGIAHPKAREVADPLSEVTRAERRALLIASVTLLAVVFGDLVPTSIEPLGLSVEPAQRSALLWLLGAVDLYLLVAFAIYARVDLAAWNSDFQVFLREKAKAVKGEADAQKADGKATADSLTRLLVEEWPYTRPFELRQWFDVWVPVLVAGGSLVLVALKISCCP